MKVVLDTNVFISGIFFSGPPFLILKAWQEDKIQFVLSKDILEEYQRVAGELSRQFPDVDIDKIIELITIHSELIEVPSLPERICSDPDDDKFLAYALISKAKVIISGDKHLLNVSGYQEITVCKPKDFIDNYLK